MLPPRPSQQVRRPVGLKLDTGDAKSFDGFVDQVRSALFGSRIGPGSITS